MPVLLLRHLNAILLHLLQPAGQAARFTARQASPGPDRCALTSASLEHPVADHKAAPVRGRCGSAARFATPAGAAEPVSVSVRAPGR